MTEGKEIRIGDKVKMKGEAIWYIVKDISIEKVSTVHKGDLIFRKLYFGVQLHRPVWDYEVESVDNGRD